MRMHRSPSSDCIFTLLECSSIVKATPGGGLTQTSPSLLEEEATLMTVSSWPTMKPVSSDTVTSSGVVLVITTVFCVQATVFIVSAKTIQRMLMRAAGGKHPTPSLFLAPCAGSVTVVDFPAEGTGCTLHAFADCSLSLALPGMWGNAVHPEHAAKK